MTRNKRKRSEDVESDADVECQHKTDIAKKSKKNHQKQVAAVGAPIVNTKKKAEFIKLFGDRYDGEYIQYSSNSCLVIYVYNMDILMRLIFCIGVKKYIAIIYNDHYFFEGFLAGKKYSQSLGKELARAIYGDYITACDGYVLPQDTPIDFDGLSSDYYI